MGGREGLVNVAVKTADTGYISRRLVKALEDLAICYDDTVRSASGSIIQFVYGDDGMDPLQMEDKKGHPLNFQRLLMKAKATCPPEGEETSLSPSEIRSLTNEMLLSKEGTLRTSLSAFIEECVEALISTRKTLGLDEDRHARDNCLESIALNISGITSRQLKVFLHLCNSRYCAKKIEPGTPVGTIGAQSIGEPGTQMTLKSFHFAGVASMNVTLGVPRIREIVNASKKISTPIIEAKLNDKHVQAARTAKGYIEKTLLGQIAEVVMMLAEPATLRITLDEEAIRASPVSINSTSVKQSILQTRDIKLKIEQIKVQSPYELIVSPRADTDNVLFSLQWLKSRLPSVVVKGINTVEHVVISQENDTYKLLIEGTGLLAVMGTDGINGCETKSNHIMEVQQTLGIEAGREKIIDELSYTMSQHSITVDLRHIMLLADLMTFKGEVLGMTRYGVKKMRDSVLMLASFEGTADHLFNASVNGREDKIEGVSECIITGTPMKIGTGMPKILQRHNR